MESCIVQLSKLRPKERKEDGCRLEFAFGFNTYNVVKVTHLSEPQFPDL